MTDASINWWRAGYQAFLEDDMDSAPYPGFVGAHRDWHKGWKAAEEEHSVPDTDDDDFLDYYA